MELNSFFSKFLMTYSLLPRFEPFLKKTISININKKIKFNLLYDSNKSLQKKIKIEQIRKETN